MSLQSPDQFFQSAGIKGFQPGQGPATFGQGAYGASTVNPAAAAIAQAQGPNYSGLNQTYAGMNGLANTLGATAAGAGPSAAQAQLTAATGAANNNLAGNAAAIGPSNMAARQSLMNAQASTLAAGGNASAQTRASEAAGAQGTLGNLLGTQGTLGLGQTAQEQGLGLANAGALNQGSQFNAGMSQSAELANAAARNAAMGMGSTMANSNFQEGQQLSAESQAQANQMRYNIQQSNNAQSSPGAIMGDIGQGLGGIASLGAAFMKEGGVVVDHPTLMRLHDQAVIPLSDTQETAEKLTTPAKDLRQDQKPVGGGAPLSQEMAPAVMEALRSATLSPAESHKILGRNANGSIRVQLANGGCVDVHPAGMPHYDEGGLSLMSPLLGMGGPDKSQGPTANLGLADADQAQPQSVSAQMGMAAPGGGPSAKSIMSALGGVGSAMQGPAQGQLGAGSMLSVAPQHFQIQHFDEGTADAEAGSPPPAQDAGVVSEVGEGNKPEAIVPMDTDSGGSPPPSEEAVKAELDQAKAKATEGGSGQMDNGFNVATAGTGADERAGDKEPAKTAPRVAQPPSPIDQWFKTMSQFGSTQQEIDQNLAKAQLAGANGDVAAAQAYQQGVEANQRARQAVTADTQAKLSGIYDQIGNGVHQMTGREWFSKKDTGGKIDTAISMAMGAAAQALTGIAANHGHGQAMQNPALEYMNKQIHDDVENQRTNLDMLGRKAEGYSKLHSMSMDTFNDKNAQLASSYAAATKIAEGQTQAAIAKLGNTQAAANLQKWLGSLQMQRQQLEQQIAGFRMDQGLKGAQLKQANLGVQREQMQVDAMKSGNPAFGNPANVVVDPVSGKSFNAGAGVEGKEASPDLAAKWDAVNAAKRSMEEANSHSKLGAWANASLPWWGNADVGIGASLKDEQATTRASSETKGGAPRESMIKSLEERTTNPAQAWSDKDRQRLISEYNDRLREYHEAASRYHRG